MATPTYAGPLTDAEVPTRHPGTRLGGAKTTAETTDRQVTTTHTLVFAVKCVGTAACQLRDGGASGTIIWVFEAGDEFVFQEPLEFPNGLYYDNTAVTTVYIQYKD